MPSDSQRLMKQDVKALVAGLVLLGTGGIALAVANIWRVSPDAGPTLAAKVLQGIALVGLAAIFAGSLAVVIASLLFCQRRPPLKLFEIGLAFLISAAIVWVISRAFPAHTNAWVFVILPWFASIFSGAILLCVALVRTIDSRRRKVFASHQ
jgi:hypothetical protein